MFSSFKHNWTLKARAFQIAMVKRAFVHCGFQGVSYLLESTFWTMYILYAVLHCFNILSDC